MSSSAAVTPLPWRQLTVICLMRLSEPVSFSVLFPFINDFLWDLKATDDRSKLGLYAGIVESLFSVTLACSVFQWSKASDHYGRKPILLIGSLGSALSSISFGLSTSFPMLIFSRCLSGALNANGAIYKSVVGEITDESNTARSLGLLGSMWVVGVSIGPALGGQLSKPAERFPSLFSHTGILAFNGLWERHAYFLPCLVAATLNLLSFSLGFFFLRESAPSKMSGSSPEPEPEPAAEGEHDERTPLLTNGRSSEQLQAQSAGEIGIIGLLKIHHIRRIIMSYALFALTSISLDSVHVLYFWEPIKTGGLSFPSNITGGMLSFGGVSGIFLSVVAFPMVQRRFGTLPIYRFCVSLYSLVPLIMPWANVVARQGLSVKHEHHPGGFLRDVGQPAQTFTLLIVGIAIFVRQMASIAFSCNMILVNQSAALVPGGTRMGALNGLAHSASTAMMAIGPYTASTLFALTLEHKWLGGHFIWLVLLFVALCAFTFCSGIQDIELLVNRGELSRESANRRF